MGNYIHWNILFNYKTKIDIINKFNIDKEDDDQISRTSFYDKENKIPFASYQNIYEGLNTIIKKIFFMVKIQFLVLMVLTITLMLANNKGYLETSLNMGFLI